jgi:hypothetical protein
MKVSELIARLQQLPQDLKVSVNDEAFGVFHENIDGVFHYEQSPDTGEDEECVIIIVNRSC